MEHVSANQLQEILNAPESKQLLRFLQEANGENLKMAIQAAKDGNYQSVEQLLKPSLSSDKAKRLIGNIEKKIG